MRYCVDLNDEFYQSIKNMAIKKGIKLSDYVRKCLRNEVESDKCILAGGIILNVPNPKFYQCSDEEKMMIVQSLSETATKLTVIHPGLDFGLSELTGFAIQRLFKDTDRDKNAYK
jgi:hypothetical protein